MTPEDYTRAVLTAIPSLVEMLEACLVDDTPDPSATHTKPTSRPPVALTVVSDLDEAFIHLRNAAATTARHADVTPPQPYWAAICDFLLKHLEPAAQAHPDAADWKRINGNITAAFEFISVHATAKEREWRPIPGRWDCPYEALNSEGQPVTITTVEHDPITGPRQVITPVICGGPLLEHTTEKLIRCPTCKRKWEGDLQYQVLGQQLGVEPLVTVAQAAAMYAVTTRTIKRWIKDRNLTTTERRGRVMVNRNDLPVVL